MPTIQEQVIANFEANIAYIEANHKVLFEKLLAYESACEKGYYQERYELSFDDGYFEVVDIKENTKLYNMDSSLYAGQVSRSINLSKKENLFITFKRPILDAANPSQRETYPILSYIQSHMPQYERFERVEKFAFFGAGLGVHIASVHEKLHAKAYLIVEDDLELFRLSLFVTPYHQIAKESRLFLSIFEDAKEFAKSAQEFLNFEFYRNHYIKYFEMLGYKGEKLKEFHLRIISQSHNIFFYRSILEQYLVPLGYIREGYKFLDMLQEYKLFKLLPLLMLGAGPSLRKHIEWVEANQQRFIIVALSSTLKTLYEHKISPDIVVHMDGFESSAAHFTKLPSREFLKNTLFFLSARTPAGIVESLPKERIYLYENGTSYKQNIGNLAAACVGSTTYLMLVAALQVQKLYLLGLDLALDRDSGATHASGHEYASEVDLNKAATHDDLMEFKKSAIEVTGNLHEKAYTTPEWLLSIESVNTTAREYKRPSQQIFNLSDGARFEKTTPLLVKDIAQNELTPIDKEALCYELQKSFDTFAPQSFTKDELSQIRERITLAKAHLKRVKKQSQKDFKRETEFLEAIPELFGALCSDKSGVGYDISLILQEFFKYILSYIYDFFNTCDIDHKTLHAEAINDKLCSSLSDILEIYIEKLEKKA